MIDGLSSERSRISCTSNRSEWASKFDTLDKVGLTQVRGEALHGLPSNPPHWSSGDGLYPIQALVRPIAMRFRYHFQGSRNTNRVDKVGLEYRMDMAWASLTMCASRNGHSQISSTRFMSNKGSSKMFCNRSPTRRAILTWTSR
jgi:hypothetical protein